MLHFITSEVCRALPLLTVLLGLCSDVKAASLEPQGQSHIYVSTHWPLHVAVMVGTLPYITYTQPVILPHESADWLRQQSLRVKPVHYILNTAVYYVLCITLTLYTHRPDVIGSILFLCLLTFQVGLQEPTRSPWSCQDLRIWPSRSIRPPSWSVSPQETQGPLFPGAG